MTDRTCSADGCDRPVMVKSRKLCSTHYHRWWKQRWKDPTYTAPVSHKGKTCSVDECQRPAVKRGWCDMHYLRWRRVRSDPRSCSVGGCLRPVGSRGWCAMHYQRWRKHGTLDDRTRARHPEVCSVVGCVKPHMARGWCSMHYTRWQTHGSLELVVPGGDPPPGTKWCRRCETYESLSEFPLTRGRPSSPCKSCRAVTNHRRRVQSRLRMSERYTAAEIADRDGWVCQICRKRIGRRFKWPHPRSFSIDHIVPTSKGGDDVKANVQAAHLHCNISKNTGGTDQLRLIG